MATVYSTTNTTPAQFPASTQFDRRRGGGDDDGDLYVIGKNSTANQYGLYRSTNNGGSWASAQTYTRSSLVELGPIFVGRDGWLRHIYRTNESSQDRIYIRGMNLDTHVWEPELLLASAGNGGVAGAVYQGIDLMQVVANDTEYYVVAAGYTSGANHGVRVFGAYTRPIPSTTFADNSVIHGTRTWLITGSGRIHPTMDLQHSGDGKTASGSPNVWIHFGRTSSNVVKLAWNGDGWTGPSSAVSQATGLPAADYSPARWDGSRFVCATRSGSDNTRIVLRERNSSNTSTTHRNSPAHSQGNIRSFAMNFNTDTKSVRVYAVGTSNADLYYVDYNRASDAWGSWTVVSTTDILGASVDNWNVRRSTYGNTRYDVITAHSGAPNTVVHTAQTVTYSPLPALWNFEGLAHTNGGARQWNSGLPINWLFQDTDPGSNQTAFALRRQIGAGAFSYWNNGTNLWVAAEVKNMTSSLNASTPANWATSAAEATHSYWVKTWNTADQTSGYTGELFTLTPSDKVNPVITSPPDSSTVTTDTVTVTWTCTDQRAFRVRVFIFGIVLSDSGKIVDAVTRSYMPVNDGDGLPFRFADAFNYSIQVNTWNAEDLVSDAIQTNFAVDFIEPALPTLVCTPNNSAGYIAVAITNPAPSGGQPAVVSQDLYRRKVGDSDAGIRVATELVSGATYNDWRAVSGVNYEYQSHVFGDNGASRRSAWTA